MSVMLSSAILPLIQQPWDDNRSDFSSRSDFFSTSRQVLLMPLTAAVDDDDAGDDTEKDQEELADDDHVPATEPFTVEDDDFFDENDFDDDFDDDFEEEYEELEADFKDNDDEEIKLPEVDRKTGLEGQDF